MTVTALGLIMPARKITNPSAMCRKLSAPLTCSTPKIFLNRLYQT